MKFKFISMGYSAHMREYLIEVEEIPFFSWFFKAKRVKYLGNCTVWYKVPDMERPGTMMELILCQMWKKAKHEASR